MSHFAVLVVVPDSKTLDSVMLPYHEYECTGIMEYTRFVICTDDLQAEYEKYGKERAFDEFVADWGNYTKDESGNYGRITNPDAKWDWWTIGGRWGDYLRTDVGTKSEMALEQKRMTRLEKSLSEWSRWHAVRAGATPSPEQINKAQGTLDGHWAKNETAQRLYPTAIELAKDEIAFREIDWVLWNTDQAQDMRLSEDEYRKKLEYQSIVHAFIDADGKWHERGDMGWFAMCNDENENTYDGENGEFWTFINNLPENTQLALIDCHI